MDGDDDYGDPYEMTPEGKKLRRIYYEALNNQHATKYGRVHCPRYDGGTGSDGRRYKPVWNKMYLTLRNWNIDIEEFVRYAVSRAIPQKPQDIVKDAVIKRYLSSKSTTDDVSAQWKAEFSHLESLFNYHKRLGKSDDDATKEAMADSCNEVGPLVRYAFACQHGLRFRVDVSLRDDAKEQYRARKSEYDRWLSSEVPEEVKYGNF